MKKLNKQIKIASKLWKKANKKSVKLANALEKLERKKYLKENKKDYFRPLYGKKKIKKEKILDNETTAPTNESEVQQQEGVMPAKTKKATKKVAKKTVKKATKKAVKKPAKKVAKKAAKKVVRKTKK